MTTPALPEVYGLKFGENRSGTHGEYFHGSAAEPRDEPVQLDYFVWLIRTPDRDIVVDAGFTEQTARRRNRRYFRTPSAAIELLGGNPASVPYVILSHFHYDHAGELAPFRSARFVVQDSEMAFWTGRFASRHEFRRLIEPGDIGALVQLGLDGRLLFVDGTSQIIPGVRVHHVGGHTAGLQVVQVDTAKGKVVLAADASHLYANFEQDAPFGVFTDLCGMYGTFDTLHDLASSPALVIPGHDPEVLKRFDPVDGLEGIAVRIA